MLTADMIERARVTYGRYRWHEWPAMYAMLDLAWVSVPLPPELRGFLWGSTVYLRAGMGRRQTARTAWHEAGHHLMHAGGCAFWLSRPQGVVTVARFDWQARQFAERFPDWGEGE